MEIYQMQQIKAKSFSKLAIASLVCGLLSLIILVPHLLWVRGIVAIFDILYGFPILSFILVLLVVGFMGLPLHLYLLIFLTIILGIMALIATRNNKDLRGKNMALFCVILGGIMVLSYIFGVYIMDVVWGAGRRRRRRRNAFELIQEYSTKLEAKIWNLEYIGSNLSIR